jgi:hypothetical protein
LGPGRRTIYTRKVIYRMEPKDQCNKHFYTCNLRCGLFSCRGHNVQSSMVEYYVTVQSVKEEKKIFFRESTPFRETATTAVFFKLDEVKELSYKYSYSRKLFIKFANSFAQMHNSQCNKTFSLVIIVQNNKLECLSQISYLWLSLTPYPMTHTWRLGLIYKYYGQVKTL